MERTGYNELLELMATRPVLESSDPYVRQLHKIKSYYLQNEGKIISWNTKYPFHPYDKSPVRWEDVFTPIESLAWEAMQKRERMVFYPQYPVGRFILDFANPARKIGLELDGREFHDYNKDLERDRILKNLGYTIIRITGSEMNKRFQDWQDWDYKLSDELNLENIKNWILNTGDGIIEAVRVFKFNGRPKCPKEHIEWFTNLCLESIDKHRLVQ